MNDISLFDVEKNPIILIGKEKTYSITFINAITELNLMQHQEDIAMKSSKWKTLTQQDLDRWKAMLIKVIQDNNKQNGIEEAFDTTDITGLYPMPLIANMMGLINYLGKRSDIITKSLAPEVQEEVKKATDDYKKKVMEKALSDSGA